MENFGLSFAEDQEENTPAEILGELRLKEGYVTGLTKEGQQSLLVEDYPLLRRVGELNLLTITAESGLLGALEAKGLTLSKLEELLPVAEKLGILSFVSSRPLIYNGLAFLLVEPAPLLIGPAVGVVEVGDKLFPALAALCAALEAKGLTEGEFSLPLFVFTALFGGLGLVGPTFHHLLSNANSLLPARSPQLLSGKIDVPDVSSIPDLDVPSVSLPSIKSVKGVKI